MIAKTFSSLLFLNAHFIGLHSEEYFRTVNILVERNISHYIGQRLFENTPNTVSETLYFMVGPYIQPYGIFVKLALYRAIYFDIIWIIISLQWRRFRFNIIPHSILV